MKRTAGTPAWYNRVPHPIRHDGAGATDFGPRDVMRDLENPDMFVPPKQMPEQSPIKVFFFRHTYAVKSWRLVARNNCPGAAGINDDCRRQYAADARRGARAALA